MSTVLKTILIRPLCLWRIQRRSSCSCRLWRCYAFNLYVFRLSLWHCFQFVSKPPHPRAPVVDEFVVQRVSRQPFHDVAFCRLVRERDGRHHVGAEVDAEDCDGAERKWNVGDDEQKKRRNFRYVARQRVCDRLLQVVEYQATCVDGSVSLYSAFSHMVPIYTVQPKRWLAMHNVTADLTTTGLIKCQTARNTDEHDKRKHESEPRSPTTEKPITRTMAKQTTTNKR